jgi:hypothetical protein
MSQAQDQTTIVYKFLPAQYALMALEQFRLKVSLVSELNDIFDSAQVFPPTDNHAAGAVLSHLDKVREATGLVCFTKDWQSLLLWGHYAESAKGLALGFERARLQWGNGIDVEYDESRMVEGWPLDPFLYDHEEPHRFVRLYFGRKAKEWEYQKEVRFAMPLESCIAQSGKYFKHFYPTTLREVIIGSRSSIKPMYIRHFLDTHRDYKGHGERLSIFEAVEHPTEYKFERKKVERPTDYEFVRQSIGKPANQ